MILNLPYPVSANRYWRSYVLPRGQTRAIVVLSEEAKAYRHLAGWAAKAAGLKPVEGRVHLDVRLYPALPKDAERRMRLSGEGWDDSVRSIDLDNALKVLIDALKGVAYVDDRQVWRITAERCEPDGHARAVVEVRPIVVVRRQMDLLGEAA